MNSRTAWMVLILVALIAAPVTAEQIRLKTGDFLQGDILGERSNEEVLTIRLYRTGGVFTLKWDKLTGPDEKRIKESLGLVADTDEEVPMIPGHRLILRNGDEVLGRLENPKSTSGAWVLLTAKGKREYPRGLVAKVEETMVPALEIFDAEKLYEMYLEEMQPETGDDHIQLAKRCMRIGAYPEAKKHYELALEDENLPDESRQMVKNRLIKVEIYVQAKDATDRVAQVRKLRFQKKFDQAIEMIDQLAEEYAERPEILELLKLDRLKRQITNDRTAYYRKEVQRRFFRAMDRTIRSKARDKEAGYKDAQLWAVTPKGLSQDIFNQLAEDLELEDEEVRELFEKRTSRQVHRYNYGFGTFVHPDVATKARKAVAAGRQSRRRAARNRAQAGQPQRQQEKPKTADEWWNEMAGTKDKERFLRAYFAEYGGILEVLRFEKSICRNCAGKGHTVTQDANSGEEVKHICTSCNLSGHERIVICR